MRALVSSGARVGSMIGATALAVLLGGCSMGNLFGGGPQPGAGVEQFATASPTQAQIQDGASSALPAIATECPPIKVRPGGQALFSYAGQAGNAQSVRYQAVIDEVSRNCVVSSGVITVRMGAAGRLLRGPQAGNTSSAELPVRFAVERDGIAVFTQRYNLPVALAGGTQSGDWVKVVENVAIPYVGGEDITIWVGFDSAR